MIRVLFLTALLATVSFWTLLAQSDSPKVTPTANTDANPSVVDQAIAKVAYTESDRTPFTFEDMVNDSPLNPIEASLAAVEQVLKQTGRITIRFANHQMSTRLVSDVPLSRIAVVIVEQSRKSPGSTLAVGRRALLIMSPRDSALGWVQALTKALFSDVGERLIVRNHTGPVNRTMGDGLPPDFLEPNNAAVEQALRRANNIGIAMGEYNVIFTLTKNSPHQRLARGIVSLVEQYPAIEVLDGRKDLSLTTPVPCLQSVVETLTSALTAATEDTGEVDSIVRPSAKGQAENSTPTNEIPQLRILKLKHAQAEVLEKLFGQLFRENVVVKAETRTNSLLLRGPATLLDDVQALVIKIDQPVSTAGEGSSAKPYGLPSRQANRIPNDPRSKAPQTSPGQSDLGRRRKDAPDSGTAPDKLQVSYAAAEKNAEALANQVRSSANPSPELQAKLRSAVAEAFALRQQLHQSELATFQHRMAKVRQTIQAREQIKEQIIDRRVADLLNPDLIWESAVPPTAALKNRTTELEGLWLLASVTSSGKTNIIPVDDSPAKVRVQGQQWTFLTGKNEERTSIVIDSAAIPKTIDITTESQDEPNSGLRRGIYRLDGDKLAVCLGDTGGKRPTSFDGENFVILAYRRVREPDQSEQTRITSQVGADGALTAPSSVKAPVSNQKFMASELEGEWSLESIKGGGIFSHEQDLKLRIQGQQWILLRGEHETPYSIVLNSAVDPKTIDMIAPIPEGRAPRIEKGIYRLTDDVLIVSFADAGKDRPSEFDGEKFSIHTWKRSLKPGQTVQLRITSPEGATITWLDQPVIVPGTLVGKPVLPLRRNLAAGKTHRLQISNIPNRPGLEQFATIEIPLLSPRSRDFLSHNAIPLQFVDEDLDQVQVGNLVVKVLYLRHPQAGALSPPRSASNVEVMVSTRLDPGADIVDEARKRGTVLAIVRMSNQDPQSHNALTDGKLILRDVQEFQRRFLEAEHLVEITRQLVGDARAALAGGTGTQAAIDSQQELVDESLKKLDLVRAAYQSQISVLDENIRLAKKSLELAEVEHNQALQANRRLPGTVAQSEMQRLEVAQAAAKLDIEHATTLLDLYRKIAPAIEIGSNTKMDDSQASAEALLWEHLGLRVKSIDANVPAGLPKYYGGLQVLEVRAESPAFKATIKAGDILIGLSKWETRTPDHAVFAIRDHADDHTTDGKETLRFYVSRNGTILVGQIEKPPFPQDSEAQKVSWAFEPRPMTYSFKAKSAYWSDVLLWLARTTDRGLQMDIRPDGQFTYGTTELRLDEILDSMNAELEPRGLQVTITDKEIRLGKKDPTPDPNPRVQTTTNLRILMKALNQYHNNYKHYPPAVILGQDGKGTVPHSWRVEILPYLGERERELYGEYHFDEPWDSPTNRSVLLNMPTVFRSPLDQADSRNTSYFGLVPQGFKSQPDPGPAGAAGGSKAATAVSYHLGTVFSNPQGATQRDISDGISNTVVLVEAKRSTPWTKPEEISDIACSPGQEIPCLGGWFPEGWHAAFADGLVKQISTDNPDSTIRALFTIGAGENVKPKVIEYKVPNP